MRKHIARKVGARTALTDLLLNILPDQDFPGRNHYFLENTNTARSIVANIEVTGTDNFQVTNLSQTYNRPFYPHKFEVRVAPGDSKFIGRDRIIKIDVYGVGGGGSSRVIMSNYVIRGARYVADESEPMPGPPSNPNDCIYMYRAPVPGDPGRAVVYAVNVDHLFGVDFEANRWIAPSGFSAAIAPTYQLGVYDSWKSGDSWKIGKHKYFVHTPSVVFGNLEIQPTRSIMKSVRGKVGRAQRSKKRSGGKGRRIRR